MDSKKIAFLGPETTFSHIAALKKFGAGAEFNAKASIAEVFSAVERNEAEFGVVPVENTMEGSIVSTYDMFLDSELNITAEITLDMKHDLVSAHKLSEIRKVFSHSQALAQCKSWLKEKLPRAELIETTSTARAAEQASLYLHSAAIATRLAAERFGLNIIAESVQEPEKNIMRFLVIGKAKPEKTEKNKTSILFSVKNEAGALFDALAALKEHNINMTKIESRPSRQKPWEVVFFIDFEGYCDDANVKKALAKMEEKCLFLRVLGSYAEEMTISE